MSEVLHTATVTQPVSAAPHIGVDGYEPGPAAPTASAGRTSSARALVVLVGVLAAIGLGMRIWIMTGRLGAIDSDEAITGLMARHLLDGEPRAFMWRLNYQGTIATYPVALSLRLFGTNQAALELPFTLMSAGAALLVWRIGIRFLRPLQAVFAALAFWLWPALYVWIGAKPLLFYVPTMLLGLGVILCAQRAAEQPRRVDNWCALGLLAGAGWWTSPNIMYFVVPTVAWLVLFHRPSLGTRALLSLPCAAVGALPWIWNDVTYGFDSLDIKDGLARGSYVDHLGYFFTHALPVALGMRAPFDAHWFLGPGHTVVYAVVLVLLGAAVALGLRERSPAAVALLACPFVFALVPFASNLDSDWIGNGRYFYFFTPFVALAIARMAWRAAPVWILAVVLTASSAWGFAQIYDFRENIGAGPPLDKVIANLERDGHHEVFASFWISSRLTFESEERVVAVATDLGPTFQAFEDRVRHSRRPVYVMYVHDDQRLVELRQRAAEAGQRLHERRVDGYVIAVPSGRLIAPPAWDLSRRP